MLKARGCRMGSQLVGDEADRLFAKASEQWERGELRSAFRLLLSGAKRGDPIAQHTLGYFYDMGIGVKRNRTAALRWYEEAYRGGFGSAATNIGTIFRDEKSTKEALRWFERAIRLGDGDANLEIARILLGEEGGAPKAIKCLKRAIRAAPDEVTPAGRQEAHRMLKRILRKNASVAG